MAQTLDTAFLKAQDPDRHASLSIGAVAVVHGAVPAHELLERLLKERILSIPRCTQLLRPHPINREWMDFPEFDLAQHVRRVAIPRPGDEAELSRVIADACERPLDPGLPPWECWVLEGLKGNRWAILMKAHHCLLDGDSAARLLTRLCDDADTSIFANHTGAQRFSPPPAENPRWVDALWRASSIAGSVTSAVVGAIWPATRTSSLDRVTALRRYGTVRVQIADVDDVCRKFGVTADDVALAAITEGFRTVLLARGEEPRADSLRALVSTAVRSVRAPYLPVDHDDPVQRLRTVHSRARQSDRPQSIVESAIDSLPTMVRSSVMQVFSRLPQRGMVTLATNAAGPRHRLRLMGQTMERLLPVPPTAVQLRTGVAVLNYDDELIFGITAEDDAAFDVKQLAAAIELGMARLVALSGDSVLLFSDHRRRRSSRAIPNRPLRAYPPAPGKARH